MKQTLHILCVNVIEHLVQAGFFSVMNASRFQLIAGLFF